MNRYCNLEHALFHRKHIGLTALVALLVLMVSPVWHVWAAAGDLDTSFSGDGRKEDLPLLNAHHRLVKTAIQADGKLLVIRYSENIVVNNPDADFELVRLNQNGSLDTSFDVDGKVTTDFGANDQAMDLVIQPDGKIIVAGISDETSSGGRMILARYLPNGSLDKSFHVDGRVYGVEYSRCVDIELQSNGKIIAYGYLGSVGTPRILARFNASGTVDTTFGNGNPAAGYTTLPSTCVNGSPATLRIQNDNRIVIASRHHTTINSSGSCLSRFTANGLFDWESPSPSFWVNDMALQGDGKILLLGDTDMRRHNTDGTLDTSFGTNGVVSLTGSDRKNDALAIQEDGRLVVAGSEKPSTNRRGLVCRYLSNGTADTSFGLQQGCRATTFPALPNDDVYFRDVLLQADGRIVAAGTHEYTSYKAVMARYENDNTETQTTDVAIGTITTSPAVVWAGTVLTYTIPIRNNSATKAAHVTLSTVVPTGTFFMGINLYPDWAALVKPSPGATGDISCSSFQLAPNTTTTVQIRVGVSAGAYWGQTISFLAGVSNTIPDVAGQNNLGFKDVTVQ